MAASEMLELELADDHRFSMNIRRRTALTSAHTGKPLEEVHGWVSTEDPEVHRWLSVALRGVGDASVHASDPGAEVRGRWQLSWNSYGEEGGRHTYGLILREVEDLSLDVLIIDTLELHPYEYREQILGDGLTIWAKMVGTHADVTRIGRLIRSHASFPVVRRGIQEEPRDMRLGVAEWSEYEDRVKYRLVLVDQAVDENLRGEMGRIQEQNNRSALGYYVNLVDRLSELLVERGAISKAELESIRDAARDEPGVARHEFWHVADVDVLT